jgi:hypothetical protein
MEQFTSDQIVKAEKAGQHFAGWQTLFLDEHKAPCGQATGKTAQLSGANEQIEKPAQRSGRQKNWGSGGIT